MKLSLFSISATLVKSLSGDERPPFEDSDVGAAKAVAVVVDEGRQQNLIIAGQGHEVPQQPKLQGTETQGPVQGTEIIDVGGEGMNKSVDSRT